MKDSYIKLPIVKSIELQGYELFKKDWVYTFKKGLNLFVGGNRLGKTTTMYIILYGIMGLPKKSTNFFSDRIPHEDQKEVIRPTVKLDLDIGTNRVKVKRDLFNSQIDFFSVNGEIFNKTKFPNIEELFSQNIMKLARISSLDDYEFLLEKLLIREEEGNYLLWNPDDQMRLLRLLFNYGKFDEEFRKLRDTVRKYDTVVRGQQDHQAQWRKRLYAIQQQKLESIGRTEQVDLQKLQKQLSLLNSEALRLQSNYKKIISDIEEKEEAKKKLTQTVYGLNSEIEELDSEIMKIENIFFQSVYADPKIQLASHKLKHYRICIFCNEKIPQDKAKSIVSDIEDKKRCPVCSSLFKPLGKEVTGEIDKKQFIELLHKNKELNKEKKQELSTMQRELETLIELLNELWEKEKKIKKEHEDKILSIDDIKLKLSMPEMEGKEDMAVYDRDIRFLQSQIDHYQKIIDKAKKDRSMALINLEQKNKEFSDRLEKIKGNLTTIFKDYTSDFFGECELAASKRKTDDSIIRGDIFVPKFGGRERTYKSQVSNSEATFLEYAFRLSLCQLFKQISGGDSLLAIETSEGIFDIGNVPILAKAISKFYDVSYLLIISNLGRPDFLKALVKKTKQDIPNRVLNYFEIGKLSEVQEKGKERFNEQLRKILED